MEMSEAVIDSITRLFRRHEDDENELLGDPISNFKHYLIEYLMKTGWNGWLIVIKYLGGVIRRSILNEVIDYCNYVQYPDNYKGKSVPLWFNKLHEDTIFNFLVYSRLFCCVSKRMELSLSYEVNMISNTLTILARQITVSDYGKIQPFPKLLSVGHQSILDTLFSNYVASEPKDFDPSLKGFPLKMRRAHIIGMKVFIQETVRPEGRNQDAGNCVLNEGGASWVLKPCSNKGEETGGGNRQVQNCLDILGRCIEENDKAMMCRSNEEVITSFEECCKEVYAEEKGGMIKKAMTIRCFDDYRLEGKGEEIETTTNSVYEEEEEEEEECYARVKSLVEELLM